jgi:hypothetical protein
MPMKKEHVEELTALISIYLGAKGYTGREIICLLFGNGNDVISTVDEPTTLKALDACADSYRSR